MAFIFADRVKEGSITFGLGDFTLDASPPLGFRTFVAAIGNTNTCFYTIVHDTDGTWESGIATIIAPNVLQRTAVLQSSNADAPVNFAPGPKTVFSGPNAQAFIDRLTVADHAAIDHSAILGVPSPETFTEADHNDPGFTHAGLPGVPGPETFINTNGEGDHVTTDHAGLPGIPVISAPAPQTYTVNQQSATGTLDLTSSTDGIHYLSLGAAGGDFDTLQVDLPNPPTDDTPFFVIFNEDLAFKGGLLSINSGAFTELAVLNPREGARFWHLGSAGTEWYVERIEPLNSLPSEVLVRFAGDSTVVNDFYYAYNNVGNNSPSRSLLQTDAFILSPTRFFKISWRSSGTGGGVDTDLDFLDETNAILEQTVLPSGVSGIADLDFTFTPNLSGSPANQPRLGLRYAGGGDKFDNGMILYGYQRDGGHELLFGGEQLATGAFLFHNHQNNRTGPSGGASGDGESAYRMVQDSYLDRLVIWCNNVGPITFDLDVRVDGVVLQSFPGLSLSNTQYQMIQLPFSLFLPKNTLVTLQGSNWSAAPGGLLISARARGNRGVLVHYGSNTSGLMGFFGRTDGGSTTVLEEFVVPLDMRLIRWSVISNNTFSGGDSVTVRRNGVDVSEYQPTFGEAGNVVEAEILFSAGQILTVEIQGFASPTKVVLQMTAEPRTDP